MSEATTTTDVREGKISASSFEIFAECPGMMALKQRLPAEALVRLETDDEAADFGTAVHLARQTGNALPLTEEQTQVYEDGLKVEQEIVVAWTQQLNIRTFHEGPREVRLWYHDSELNPATSAQLDVHFISDEPPGHLCIIDWKALTCPRLTPAQRNWQGRVQCVCAWEEYEITSLMFAFCKPKVSWQKKDMVLYNAESLSHAKFAIDHALWAAKQEGAPRRPGGHCWHCPCKAACPEAGALSLLPSVIASRASGTVQFDPDDVQGMVDAMTHEDLLKMWRMKTLVEKILAVAYKRLKELPDDVLKYLGLEKTEGRRMDPLADIQGVVHYLMDKGWSEADIYQCMREDAFSKEKLAEAIATRENIAKKWAQKRIPEEFGKFITPKQSDGGLKLIKGI